MEEEKKLTESLRMTDQESNLGASAEGAGVKSSSDSPGSEQWVKVEDRRRDVEEGGAGPGRSVETDAVGGAAKREDARVHGRGCIDAKRMEGEGARGGSLEAGRAEGRGGEDERGEGWGRRSASVEAESGDGDLAARLEVLRLVAAVLRRSAAIRRTALLTWTLVDALLSLIWDPAVAPLALRQVCAP